MLDLVKSVFCQCNLYLITVKVVGEWYKLTKMVRFAGALFLLLVRKSILRLFYL